MSYSDVSEHQWMLEDSIRVCAYETALCEVVRPSTTVLDFGTGLGILAMLAARAGARTVYAVDRLPIVHRAARIARDNGLTQVVALQGSGDELELPERVDLLVSEFMGSYGLHEGLLPALLRARDKHLRPGGAMIPETLDLFLGLLTSCALYDERQYFTTRPYGFDFSSVAPLAHAEVLLRHVSREDVVAAAHAAHLPLVTMRGAPTRVEATLVPERAVVAYGLVGWFSARLSASVTLETGPFAPRTHWAELVFPFSRPVPLAAGAQAHAATEILYATAGHTRWRWSLTTASDRIDGDDFMHLPLITNPV